MKKIVGILIVVLLGVCLLKPKEKVQLDNVILKQEVNNKTFAMYREESENNYVPVEGTQFPEGYVLNIKTSKCIDNNGNELENVLSYENNAVTITSGNTTYCYLYFDKSLGLEIKEENPNGLKTDKVRGEMYRFQGQQSEGINNYICFGTSDKDTCTSDKDHYMYRIIGIEASSGRVKVIKKEALEQKYQWYTDYNTDIDFPNSKIYEAISKGEFLENDNYVPKGWEEKISDNIWTYGDMLSDNPIGARQNGEGLYLAETGKKGTIWDEKTKEGDPRASASVVEKEGSAYYGKTFYYIRHNNENWTKSFKSKVSLMYLHDYSYSISDTAVCHIEAHNYEICPTGWIHLSQNDDKVPIQYEWTMTRIGFSTIDYYFDGFYVRDTGSITVWNLTTNLSARPVFYINASEELLSGTGTGTLEDPFIIKS